MPIKSYESIKKTKWAINLSTKIQFPKFRRPNSFRDVN